MPPQVRRHHLANRVFTLGIGSAADRHLVKGLARAGRGTAAFTQQSENIAAKVIIVMVTSNTLPVSWPGGEAAEGGSAAVCA